MIELTDRYGGNLPSTLRGCRNCEAMGVYPTHDANAGIAPRATDEDGWHFVTCEECHGTARVSWLATVSRIPGWLVKSMRFTFVEAPRFHTGKSRLFGIRQGFKCSVLADLGLWRP